MTSRELKNNLDSLRALDADLDRALDQYGYPEPRPVRQGFDALLRIIVSQQISEEAATSIFKKVETEIGSIDPRALESASDEALRNCGMSARKVEYARNLARSVLSGDLDFGKMKRWSDEEVVKKIQSLRGLGRWSAEIFLMFGLGRKDIFAADDLALRVALSKLKRKRKQMTPDQCRKAAQHWSPHRTSGCIFLWHYYRGAPQ